MAANNVSRSVNAVLRQYAPSEIRSRGERIFSTGKMTQSSINWEDGLADFRVMGTSEYTVQLRFKTKPAFQIVSVSCTCPYREFCKHSVAALLAIKKEGQQSSHEQMLKTAQSQLEEYGYKVSKVEETGQASRRSSGEPYIIPQIENLTRERLGEHSAQSAQPYLLQNLKWRFTGKSILATGEVQEYWRGDLFQVGIELTGDEQNLSVTCDCNRRVKKLCAHAYSALFQILEENEEDENFFMHFTQQAIEDFARSEIEGYGVPFTKDWQKNFEVDFSSEGFKLRAKGKYKGLLNPYELKESTIDKMLDFNPEWELGLVNTPDEAYHCGFYFRFSDFRNYVELQPIVGMLGKQSSAFQKKIKPLERAGRNTYIHYGEGDESLVRLSQHLVKNPYLADNTEMLARHFRLLRQVGQLLENHPRVYVNDQTQYYNATVPKKHLHHVNFQASSPEVKIVFSEKDGFVYGEPHVVVQDRTYPLQSEDVQPRQYFFVQCKDQLYLHSSLREAETFHIFFGNGNTCCAVELFPALIQNLWGKLSHRYSLDFSKVKSYQLKQEEPKAMQKELYLSEVGNFVVFKPISLYGKDLRVESLCGGDPVKANGKRIIRQQRDREFEQEFIRQIRDLHPSFEKQNRSDFFHLSYEEFLDDQWFLKVFPKMQEYGIEVMGWKDLKKFNVNPNPAKVSFSFNQKTDWFEAEADIVFGDSRISLEELKKQITPEGYIKLDDGSLGVLPEEWLRKFEKMFHHAEVKKNKLKVSTKLFSLVDELFEEIDDEKVRGYIEEKKQKLLNFEKIQAQPLPKGIKASLRHYQEDGYNWLCFLDEFQWGGILADDMGLGKTLQVITFLKHVLKKNKQTNLVIVPTSLLFNWENELKKFAPSLKVHFYYGNDRLKDTAEFDQYQIVFTSYGLMTRDIDILREYSFNYIVLDESQAIKNPASKRYKAARLLQARNRITLTGTPIENNTFDLYAQMSFLNPGLLGSAAGFKKEYAKAIDQKRDAEKAADLQKIIRPFVLRRTKDQVATELPDKIEDVLYCEMKPAQRKVYDAFRNKYRDMLAQKIEDDGLAKSRFSVLEGLTKLRQICDTPEILSGDERYETPSAKIDELLKHIVEKTGKHKILIFSQFVKMLKVIEGKIQKEGITYEYLDGQSSIADRQKSVANFQENEDCRVFLISLKAGGTGLNLVAADYVYLVDPWWNPAVENQAIDRCYRIGQDKKVIAYRMICKNSVEEKILELQQKKKAVASDIITTDENVLKQLGKEDIMELFA